MNFYCSSFVEETRNENEIKSEFSKFKPHVARRLKESKKEGKKETFGKKGRKKEGKLGRKKK